MSAAVGGASLRPVTGGAMRGTVAAEGPGFVVHVELGDGATGILRDSPVVTRLSRCVDRRSVTAATFGSRTDPVPSQRGSRRARTVTSCSGGPNGC